MAEGTRGAILFPLNACAKECVEEEEESMVVKAQAVMMNFQVSSDHKQGMRDVVDQLEATFDSQTATPVAEARLD